MSRARYQVDPHWHCCPTCRQRYEDVCLSADVDSTCVQCRTGAGWQLLRKGRETRDCCVVHSRPISKDERKRLKLAGAGDWWGCRVCGRSQGYDPAIRTYPSETQERT